MAYRRGDGIIRFTPAFLPFTGLYHIVLAAVRLFGWLVYRIRFTGRENLRAVRGAILVSNHTLLLDPGLIAHAIRPRRTYFTMLEETALIPFLGTFVRLLGAVPIPERAGALRTLEAAARTAVRELGLIHFFPEGECYLGNQDIQPFHPGAFLLACRLGLPVVPITTVLRESRLCGKNTLCVLGRTLDLPPKVSVVIGRAVQPPPAASTGDAERNGRALKRAAREMSFLVRESMQATIDREEGSRALYRGMMPRLVRHPPSSAPAAELATSRTVTPGARAI
jgi:1-acyl-sn-glycerol-3-phosphate acyltransferase